MNNFYKTVQNGYYIDIIYIDFAKAFDSVPIQLLLKKIKMGISGKIYKFIENFLIDRSFKVKINENFSTTYKTHSGVPQGSVLGPLLFLIFINDLPNNINENVNIKLYADDVKLYINHKNDSERDKLSKAIVEVEYWSKSNGLEISSEKCYVLHIGRNNMKKEYKTFGLTIKATECIKDLGILTDSKLTFNQHIDKIIKVAYIKSHHILRVVKREIICIY